MSKRFLRNLISIFEFGGISKHLMTDPLGNIEFCSLVLDLIECLGEAELTVSLGDSH